METRPYALVLSCPLILISSGIHRLVRCERTSEDIVYLQVPRCPHSESSAPNLMLAGCALDRTCSKPSAPDVPRSPHPGPEPRYGWK